jgi:hypothetical protein
MRLPRPICIIILLISGDYEIATAYLYYNFTSHCRGAMDIIISILGYYKIKLFYVLAKLVVVA